MTAPFALPPACVLYVNGVRYADGQPTEDPAEPVALTDLRVTWGRSSTLDQPAPASCTFSVMDMAGGLRFGSKLKIGARIEVRANATIYPDPTDPTFADPGFETTPVGGVPSTQGSNAWVVAVDSPVHSGSRSIQVNPIDATKAATVIFPPKPFGGISSWDDVPRTLAGQTWHVQAALWLGEFLAVAQGAKVFPVAFSSPSGAPGSWTVLPDAIAAAPVGQTWQIVSGDFVPPPGVWLGVAVQLFPTGPTWAQLPADMDWTEAAVGDPGPPPSAGLKITAFGDSITAGTWLTYADSWIPKLATRLGVTITNRAVGGAALHSPGADPNVIMAQVDAALATTTRTNLVTNPGYEVGTASISSALTSKYAIAADTTAPIAGSRSALLTRTASALDSVVSQLYLTITTGQFPVTAGVPVTSGLSIKADGSGLRISTQYFWYDASNVRTVATGTIRQSNTVAGTTYRVTETATPIPGTVTAYFVVTVQTASGNAVVGQKVWADQLTIEYGTTDGGYFDGSTPDTATTDYSWTGTANASTSTAVTTPPPFTHAVILAGTNDLITHDSTTLSQSVAAAQAIQTKLAAKGVRVIWLGILPRGVGSAQDAGTLPTILARRQQLNASLKSAVGGGHRWVDTDSYFGATGSGQVWDSATWLLDGLHPNPAGASQVANRFPLDILNPSFTGYHPTWQELSAVWVDDLAMLAPAAGALRTGSVFAGRVTDMTARWDETVGGTVVDVTAQDDTAELANRYVGDNPWPAESIQTRFGRVVSASGQSVAWTVDPAVQATQIGYKDVDSQPATRLLQMLAQSVGGVLWSATSTVSGPFLRLEDIDSRPALYVLEMGGDGLVHVVVTDDVADSGIVLSACSVMLEPARWEQTSDDDSTRVALVWEEQTTDAGPPAVIRPTQRTVTVVDAELERVGGQRRVGVSTVLSDETTATHVADSLLARLSRSGWRISGLEWRLELEDRLDAGTLSAVMQILDGTTRLGLPILLDDLPDWSPVSSSEAVPLFLEGGRFSSVDGAWRLELLTSSAENQGAADTAWQDVPADWAWNEFGPEVSWADLTGVSV